MAAFSASQRCFIAPELLLDVGELLLERLEPRLRGVVGLLAQRLALDLELDAPALELVELDRHRIDLHPQPRGRLVDEVDRLVGQEALGDVAVGQRRRGDERRIGDPDAVVDLVPLAQPAQDRDRLLDRRLVDQDRLEAALERGVLLDVLAVLVERRRADGVQLAAGEHRLEQVGGVHRALGRAGADDRVELVDEQDDLALGVLDLLEDGLQPLLELAAELGAGDERAEVERDDALVLEPLGHVAADDPLGEPLGDGRLADAGLADEDRVVLGPARQDLDDAPDLVVAADDRVELAGPCLGRQVAAVLLERGVGALRVRRRDPLAAADALERLEQRLATGGVALEQGLALATDLGDREQEVLGRDVLVAEARGLGLGQLDDAPGARIERQRAALDPGAPGEDRRQLAAERGQVDAEPAKRLGRDAVVRLDERGQDVLGVEDRAVEPLGGRLGGDDGLLGLLGEAIELHRGSLLDRRRSVVAAGSGWSTRSKNVRAAVLRLVGQVGREDDAGLDVQVAVALALEPRHALAGEAERPPGLGPGRDRQQDAALEGLDRDLAAEERLLEGQRQLALEVRAAAGEPGVGQRRGRRRRGRRRPGPRPVSLIRVPVSAPFGIVISSRLPSTSTRRVVPWYASSRVISAVASWAAAWRRPGAGRAGRPAVPRPARRGAVR